MSSFCATLLLVDRDSDARCALAQHLQARGFTVLEAENSVQAQEQLVQQPDLVLTDLHEPQMLELLKSAHSDEMDLPVLVLSSARKMSDVLAALRLGAVDYLFKPLHDYTALEGAIAQALQRVRRKQESLSQLERANAQLQASLKLLQEDQNAGRQVQLNMLPQTPWQSGPLNFEHLLIPSLYLSGDFVDYFHIDEQRIAFYLADVSGHGASSAFVTALLKFMSTRLLYESRRHGAIPPEFVPSQVFEHINRGLLNCKLGKHVTMLGGVIDLKLNKLTYSVAGHLPLPVLFSQGQAQYLQGRGMPIGLFADARYSDHELTLPETFSLLLCSDGILEVLPGAGLQEREALLPKLVSETQGSLPRLLEQLGLAKPGEIPDDIALLVLSRNLA